MFWFGWWRLICFFCFCIVVVLMVFFWLVLPYLFLVCDVVVFFGFVCFAFLLVSKGKAPTEQICV